MTSTASSTLWKPIQWCLIHTSRDSSFCISKLSWQLPVVHHQMNKQFILLLVPTQVENHRPIVPAKQTSPSLFQKQIKWDLVAIRVSKLPDSDTWLWTKERVRICMGWSGSYWRQFLETQKQLYKTVIINRMTKKNGTPTYQEHIHIFRGRESLPDFQVQTWLGHNDAWGQDLFKQWR